MSSIMDSTASSSEQHLAPNHLAAEIEMEEGRIPSKSVLSKSFVAVRSRSRLATAASRDHQNFLDLQNTNGPLRVSTHSSEQPTTLSSEAFSTQTSKSDPWRWGRKSFQIIHRHPLQTLLPPLVLLALLVGLGIYGVIAAANAYTKNLQVNAWALVHSAGRSFGDQVNLVWGPQDTLSQLIQANPSVDYWRGAFKSTASSLLMDAAEHGVDCSLVMLQVQPHGISQLFAEPFLPGLLDRSCTDLLTSPGNPQQAAFMLNVVQSGVRFFNGPLPTTDTETGRVYPVSAWLVKPVFISNVSRDEEWGFSFSDSPAAMQCVASGPCYNSTTRTKWWGFVTSFFDFQPLISGSQSSLIVLTDHGFSYKVIAPHPYTQKPTVLGHEGNVDDASAVKFEFGVPYSKDMGKVANPWVLSISPNDGWQPSWRNPLIAAVVVISLVVSILVLVTIVGVYRQRDLLKESREANVNLVTLAQNLEQEKRGTEALVARQLNLIECLGREAEEAVKREKRLETKLGSSDVSLVDGKAPNQAPNQALSIHQIDIIRKELIERTSKMMNKTAMNQGFKIPDLEILHIIGEGSFGKVFKCLWRGSPVALKTLLLPANMTRQEKREKMAVMEAAISSSLSHPNICSTFTYSLNEMKDSKPQSIESSEDSKNSGSLSPTPKAARHLGYEVQLVLEYCDLGCLRSFLDNQGFNDADMPTTDGGRRPCLYSILATARDIASAMTHMHVCNVMHLDLKARNIMLKSCGSDSRGFVAKVADFGLSSKLPDSESATHESGMFQGTMSHMAPEMMTDGRASRASDVYAFGILLWELYTADKPWRGINRAHLAWEVTKEKRRPEFPIEAPREYVDLADQCWAPQASERPTFQQVHRKIVEMIRLVEDAMHARPMLTEEGTGE